MAYKSLTFRVSEDEAARLEKATDPKRDAMAPTKTAILRRGLVLALAELDRKRGNGR